jgi:hypothetical protein
LIEQIWHYGAKRNKGRFFSPPPTLDLKRINKKPQKTSQKIWQIKKKGISLQPAMEKAAFYVRLA